MSNDWVQYAANRLGGGQDQAQIWYAMIACLTQHFEEEKDKLKVELARADKLTVLQTKATPQLSYLYFINANWDLKSSVLLTQKPLCPAHVRQPHREASTVET